MVSRVFGSLILCLFAITWSNKACKIYHLGDDGIAPPAVISRSEPEYPKDARERKIEGIVALDIVIERDGKVENVRLVYSPDPGLAENAIKAVKTWQFKPCQKRGKPVRCGLYIELQFHLDAPTSY